MDCRNTYKTKFSLTRHMKQHEGKMYHCKLCPKSFTLLQYLREHTHTHTGDKPYVCTHPGCNKSFRQSGKFSLHKKIHKEESKENCKAPLHEDTKFSMKAMEVVFNELKNFMVPEYFYSKKLPDPTQIKSEE